MGLANLHCAYMLRHCRPILELGKSRAVVALPTLMHEAGVFRLPALHNGSDVRRKHRERRRWVVYAVRQHVVVDMMVVPISSQVPT